MPVGVEEIGECGDGSGGGGDDDGSGGGGGKLVMAAEATVGAAVPGPFENF